MSQLIDWPGIRAAAVAIGLREALRQASSELPQIEQQRFINRGMKRSEREAWFAHTRSADRPAPATGGPKPQPMSAVVSTGAQSLQNTLAEHGNATKSALAKAARRGAEHLAESKNASAIVKSHHALRNITAAGSQLHGWEAKSGPAANVMVNIALLGVEPGSVTVQGQIVDDES